MSDGEPKKYYPKPDDFQPVADWPPDHPWFGSNRVRCQAWNKNQGRQCLSQAVTSKGRKVCRTCGGMSPDKGPTHPRWETGKYSEATKAMQGFKKNYEASLENTNLSLEEEIALLDARLLQLVSRAHDEGGASLFDRLQTHMREFDSSNMQANRLKEDERARAAALAQAATHLNAIRELISEGHREASLWHDIHTTLEMRRRFTDSQRKMMVDAHRLMRTDLALAQIDIFMSEVIAIVRDPGMLTEIMQAYQAIPILQD